MEQPHHVSETIQPAQQEEIDLLDILVTLAENIKLLILGPLLVGLCALGIAYIVPQTFESIAVLKAEQATASLMTTAAVLNPVAAELGLTQEDSPEEARRRLREQRAQLQVAHTHRVRPHTASGTDRCRRRTPANLSAKPPQGE